MIFSWSGHHTCGQDTGQDSEPFQLLIHRRSQSILYKLFTLNKTCYTKGINPFTIRSDKYKQGLTLSNLCSPQTLFFKAMPEEHCWSALRGWQITKVFCLQLSQPRPFHKSQLSLWDKHTEFPSINMLFVTPVTSKGQTLTSAFASALKTHEFSHIQKRLFCWETTPSQPCYLEEKLCIAVLEHKQDISNLCKRLNQGHPWKHCNSTPMTLSHRRGSLIT